MVKDPSSFCALILSYKRAGNVKTLGTLQRHGYTGPWYVVLGNDDPTHDDYVEEYGAEHVVVFDKEAYAETSDLGINSSERAAILFARNAAPDIAKSLGYDYFIELDDDYMKMDHRYNSNHEYIEHNIVNLDAVFAAMTEFVHNTGIVVAMSQNGDWVGGPNGNLGARIGGERKAMNSFVRPSDDPVKFRGLINEDVNTYTELGGRGHVFLTTNAVSLKQTGTQQSDGGLSTLYQDNGTYVKAFHTIMRCPSNTKVWTVGHISPRIHHITTKRHAFSKILHERHKKPRAV